MGIANIWQDVVTDLENNYKCIVHDSRGYGRSSKPATKEFYSVERHAQDTKQILNELGIKKDIILVTHSMGGNIATVFANKYPEVVKGIIYTGTYYWVI